MKKAILLLALITAGFTGFAQTTYGVKVGPNFSTMNSKGSGITSKGLIGIEGGVYANLPVMPDLEVQASLLYSGKGGKYNFSEGYQQTQRLNYLTLPLDLLYRPEMADGSGSWFLGGGPYIAYGVSGKESSDAPGSSSADPFKAYGGSAALKRLDAGAHVQVGYEASGGFNISLNGGFGLLNIVKQGTSQKGTKNTAFSILLGYTFGKR